MPESPLDRIINWASRVFKTDLRYLIRGTAWGVLSQIASVIASLALSIILARFIPKEVYGNYRYILSLVALLPLFSLTGLGSAVLQSVSRGFDGALAEAFRTNLRWSYGTLLGTLAIALYYFLQGNSIIAVGVLLGGCLSPFMASASLASSFLVAKKDFRRNALYFGILGSVAPAIALIITALLTPNAIALAAVYFVSNVLADIALYWYTVRAYRPRSAMRDPDMLSYAKHLSLMGVLGGIAGNLDQILLFHFAGSVELAVYNFAAGIPNQIKGPYKNLDNMFQTRFAVQTTQNVRDNMATKLLLLLVATAAGIALYFLLAPDLYRIFYPNYIEAIPYSEVYMLSFIGLAFTPAYSYLAAHKRVRELYITSIASYAVQIVGITIGILFWGLWGLIWGIVLARVLTGLLWYLLYLNAVLRSNWVQ